MRRNRREVVQLAVGLTLAILFDTVQQLAWKVGILAIPETDSFPEKAAAALHEPLLGLVAVLMVLRLINWLKVLELADLSYAQPVTSLSYVTVAGASALYLHETLSPLQMIGIAIIMAGVWCVSQTERKTPEAASS